MYTWIWRHLPGGTAVKAVQALVLVLAVCALLLFVDPARLSDPVRFEPGVPGDPASMRFPHLYGPLPVTAVVGTVPWPEPRGAGDLPAL